MDFLPDQTLFPKIIKPQVSKGMIGNMWDFRAATTWKGRNPQKIKYNLSSHGGSNHSDPGKKDGESVVPQGRYGMEGGGA